MDTMKAMRAVVVVAAAAMCGTVWGAAPGGKAQDEAKPRAKAVAKKQVKKVPRAKAPVARRAVPQAKSRTSLATRATVAPREPYWTALPPSRFYPNGIPELRPEFLHPLPQQPSRQEAAATTSQGSAGHADFTPSSGGL